MKRVEFSQQARIAEDIDESVLTDYNADGVDYLPEGSMQRSESLATYEDDTALKYCIIASVILHVLFFFVLTRAFTDSAKGAVPRPRGQVTQVRLIEPTSPPKKEEPPPKQSSAISDRNHTAVKPRLPKKPPLPTAPIGRKVPLPQRFAALKPPMAPEELVTKPREEKPRVKPEQERTNKTERARKDKTQKQPSRKRPTARKPPRKRDLRNLDVDIAPTPAEIARGLAPHSGSPNFYPEGDEDEVVVDINTRENKFFSYLLHLKKKIQGVWVYPSSAARAGIGGSLTLEFSVASNGQLLFVNLLDSSGHAILDQSAMQAIETAAPYFPFPPRMKAKRLRIRANFNYVTGDFFRRIL